MILNITIPASISFDSELKKSHFGRLQITIEELRKKSFPAFNLPIMR